MKEDLLTYLWQNQLFNGPLITDDEEIVSVQHPGYLNHDSGPDFSNARIRIGNTTWAGNIELHINASDWYRHQHHKDKAYNNIILHVLMNNDADIYRPNGEKIPAVSLQGKYSKAIKDRYQQFMESRQWLACEGQLHFVKPVVTGKWLERMAIERFEKRAQKVQHYLDGNQYDWEQAYFQLLCRSFGFKTNAEPFEMLGRQIPLKIIQRNSQSLKHTEAILFGQSGFLEEKIYSQYHEKLRFIYYSIRQKHNLQPIPKQSWKFMRLRPSNFPTVRIAQLASLLWKSTHLLSPVLKATTAEEIKELYNVTASDYWITHYHFDKAQETSVSPKRLGELAVNLILINTVIPFLFVYGKYHNKPVYQDRALDWLMQIPPEKNNITKKYIERDFPCDHAMHSQALIQMRESYCRKKKCLHCHIGHHILSKR
ncbi:MAG: DUF2851 family protein [Bacteroidales bacterium]|nr:DUF2851 family protein [Bacteroidales bacterium]